MGARIIADRSLLLSLWLQHPDWPNPTLAQATGRSVAWVKQWKARLRAAPHPEDEVWGRSHLPAPGSRFSAAVVARVLQIRDEPPEHVHRTPGPNAMLYSLARTASLQGEQLPRDSADHLEDPVHRRPDCSPSARRPPIVGAPRTPGRAAAGLQGYRPNRPARLRQAGACGSGLRRGGCRHVPVAHGRTQCIVDRRDRVWSASHPPGADWPPRASPRSPATRGCSAARGCTTFPPFVRFWYALRVQPVVNPPHRPELNAFVERLHGTLERAYRQQTQPNSLQATRESLPLFQQHYNTQRPHQGRSCHNRPPAIAFAQLPLRPPLPARVDPDRWLQAYHGRCFARRVKGNGSVHLDEQAS